MARLLYRLGLAAQRRRLAVVLVWLVLLVGAGIGALTLSGTSANNFSIPGQESTTALEKIKSAGGGGATAQVVIKAPAGQKLTTPENAQVVGGLVAKLNQLPGAVGASNPLDPAAPAVNPGQDTAYSTVSYSAPPGGVSTADQDALFAAVDQARAGGFTAEVKGEATMAAPHIGGATEAVGMLGITIATGFMDLQSTTSALAGMLGLAVGIDYALFIINRYRHELREGKDVPTAIATAVGTAGSAVLTAGITVIIALLGLIVVGIPFLTQMGVAAAATIVVAVLVALTLVPAVLGFLGKRALPRKQRQAPAEAEAESKFYGGWIGTVTKRRVSVLLLAIIGLGAIALPVTQMRTTLVQIPPAGSTQERAEALLTDAFGAGVNGPLIVLFEGPQGSQQAMQAVGPIDAIGDTAMVVPPKPGPPGMPAMLTVIPESGPTSEDTEHLVSDLRDYLAGLDGVEASVTGATAVSVDVAVSLDEALPIYLVIVVGLALLLLVLVFRSLLVPLVGVLGFLLTVGASLGATVAVFQWGWLGDAVNLDAPGPLISLTPILVIGILFGLAMDYQIFLVSRMHEAHHRGASPKDAITTGFKQAAPVVVAAALIMFFVFAGFVPAGEPAIKSIAFALAIGILADAFVVRMILVPAALALLGERAWWLPSWLRWLPVLDVEGAALTEERPKPKDREPVNV